MEKNYEMKPHRCPVCGGKGTVPASFYDNPYSSGTSNVEVECKSCNGNGIIIC